MKNSMSCGSTGLGRLPGPLVPGAEINTQLNTRKNTEEWGKS
ncbi:hypothetical protein [Neobacillus cucumis]|nr:hypothetical protein [Neobacillus cucumis]